jgi:Lrp/AsnC family transcriptional regulator, leucine-responsive regulatory protein
MLIKEIEKELFIHFKKVIGEYSILRLSDSNYFPLKLLGKIDKQRSKKEDFKVSLDKHDRNILRELNKNSRASYVELTQKVSLSANAIKNRIKSLEKNGVIQSYKISIDWAKLGFEWYGIQLKNIKSMGSDKKIINYFINHPKIIFYYEYEEGNWDYDFGIIVRNSRELREFINEFRAAFFDVFKIIDAFLVLEETSWFRLPEGVF